MKPIQFTLFHSTAMQTSVEYKMQLSNRQVAHVYSDISFLIALRL